MLFRDTYMCIPIFLLEDSMDSLQFTTVNLKIGITEFGDGSIEIIPLESESCNAKASSIVLDSYFESDFEEKIKDSLFKSQKRR